MDREALHRLIEGHEAAAAMELWDLRPDLFDSPPDVVREREVAQVRATWARLRRAMARKG